jgi:hypothetical protein
MPTVALQDLTPVSQQAVTPGGSQAEGDSGLRVGGTWRDAADPVGNAQ